MSHVRVPPNPAGLGADVEGNLSRRLSRRFGWCPRDRNGRRRRLLFATTADRPTACGEMDSLSVSK